MNISINLSITYLDVRSKVIRRKATVSSRGDFEQPFKVTLAKKNKKDGWCCSLFFVCQN